MSSGRWAVGWVCVATLFAASAARAQYDSEVMNACVNAFGTTLACDINGPIAPQRPQMVVLHFAAVAISASTLRAGASHGQNSLEEAERAALSNCHAMKANDCKILNWARNECVALATSKTDPTAYGSGADADRSQSAEIAMQVCRREGGKNCILKATVCAGDDPRFSSPLPLPSGGVRGSVDPRLVGTWQMFFNPGR